MAEQLLDKASYSILRTNPRLTGNVKLLSNGNNIYLESFSANDRLSASSFKGFKVDGKSTYDNDVYNFFQQGQFPKDLAYDVFQEFEDVSVLSDYANQYEMFYSSGARAVASESYNENIAILSPLWLKEQIPNYFVVFRIDDPAAVNNVNALFENQGQDLAQTSEDFTKNVLEKCTAIKTFDLTEKSLLGSYIRRYRNQESFPKAPLNVTWRKDEPILWSGISYNKGGFTSAGNYSYDDLIARDSTIIQNEYFFTEGFKRNGILLANLINMEFLFSDPDADTYSINRYFGLYVNEVEEGKFDISGEGFFKNTEKTQLPKISSVSQVSEQLNTSFEIRNDKGVLVYIDPAKTTEVTGVPTPARVNEVESIFYVKDKKDQFHTIKKGSNWSTNQIRLFDKKIDISLLAGFKAPDTFANAIVIKRKGNATCSFNILGEIPDGSTITFYDGTTVVGQVAASSIAAPTVGQNVQSFFNPNGTPAEIAKAMTSAINQGIPKNQRFFNASYNKDSVYVESRFSGSRFNRLKFEINFAAYPELQDSLSTYPVTNAVVESANFVGGNDTADSLLRVEQGDQDRFTPGNFIQTKDGFATIGDWVPYLDEPVKNNNDDIIGYNNIDRYIIITLDNDQITVTRNNQVALYSDYRPSFGRFSFFPVRDFDFDFYSNEYSEIGELNYEEAWYNTSTPGSNPPDYIGISKNPDIRSFYEDGGFSNLLALLKQSDPDVEFDSVISSEYQRLEENFLKEQAVASRVIPYINKWSWYNDGMNVRNKPYRLNLSMAFGPNNFAPSRYERGQSPRGFSHEWYYLSEFPKYFSQDAIRESWSYIDIAPVDSIEPNPLTGDGYVPGTFQRTDKDFFNDYFIADKFTTGGITLIDRQLRYGRFSGGDEQNFAEAFLRGVRIIAKPKTASDQFANFNAKKLSYIRDARFNDYRFSAILIPNQPDKPDTQIKFIKNEKWKTIVMLIFITIDDDCFNAGDPILDRTTLYSANNKYVTNGQCEPIVNTDGGYEYENGSMQGAISFAASFFDSGVGEYLIQGVSDINNIDPMFLTDITIGIDGQYTPIEFTVGGDTYKIAGISRVVSDDKLYASMITKNGLPVTLPSPVPTSSTLLSADYITIGGGYTDYVNSLNDIGFSRIFRDVNEGNPEIKYETITEDGVRLTNENGTIAQTFTIELRAQDDILKSVYLGTLPDQAKPTVFNLTDIIGYDLSLQKKPRIVPIGRHSGYYEPLGTPILFFRDPYLDYSFPNGYTGSTGTGSTGTGSGGGTDDVYKEKVLELCRYANTQFNSADDRFGQIKDMFYHKVNEEDPSSVLELSKDSAFLSLYPLINEIGISFRDFYTFSSNWDPGYFIKNIDKSKITDVIGTRSMKEKKSFYGSKYLKVPQRITLETFAPAEFLKDAVKNPSLVRGDFMHIENESNVEFFLFIRKRLINFLFIPIKETFKKYINPEFGFGNTKTIDDDVSQYIQDNILQLYKIESVNLYVRETRENIPLTFITAELNNENKAANNLNITTAFASSKINTNPFDLKLIYNKRTGFSEAFGFSVTLVKK